MSWSSWVAFWSRKESAAPLAALRIALGLVFVYDFTKIGMLDLVLPLYGDLTVGGLSDATARNTVPFWASAWGASPWAPWMLWGGLLLSSVAMATGFFTRTAAVIYVLLSAQHALVLPHADRGIDMLTRNVLCVLACSGAGTMWSVDAKLTTGSFEGNGEPISAWPRMLIVVQLVTMYFTAGVQKYAMHWWPWGGHSALYVILHDPPISRFAAAWLAEWPGLWFTKLGTLTTIVWELTAPLMLLTLRSEGGDARVDRLRNRLRAMHFFPLWVATGAVFHGLIALLMNLGIFPWAMLALYPAWHQPTQKES